MRTNMFKVLGPLAAIAALGGLAGCNWGAGSADGVPLAELDLSGEAPHGVALMGPDRVTISDGADFTIEVDGSEEIAARLRFALDNGTLGITREPGDWNDGEVATVRITLPAPRKLSVAGSGRMTSERLAGDAEVVIAGSGTLETPRVEASALRVSIAGSGDYIAGGRTESLELAVAGSGRGEMSRLQAGRAEVNIAGSGEAVFASDGEVSANIMGSGNVTVRGSARCTVNALGSGSLTCEREPAPAG